MSIQQNFESTIGLSLKEAYHKIVKVEVDYIANTATFWIAVFVDNQARQDNRAPVFVRKVVINKIGDTLGVRKKLYTYLKTTNDYQEAKDV
jgi:hypothetical protein